MADFESGVSGYVTGRAQITVHFPVDMRGHADISCAQCPYYSRSARICRLNNTIPAYPDKYVGDNCPLEREDV